VEANLVTSSELCWESVGASIAEIPMSTSLREMQRRMASFFLPAKSAIALPEPSFIPDFEKRANNVRKKIRAKYKRLIQTPYWSNGELKQHGRGLRKHVRRWEEEKKRTERRLMWDVRSYLALIDRHGKSTKACERMALIVAEQKKKAFAFQAWVNGCRN
jgi:hypothetical protein